MRYLSVCSGIEAATVAWHPLGWTPAAFSEIEAFPRAVLGHHYPDVPLHGDFTTIGADEYGPIDLLVGGTPCQSFSIAGLRGGLADERGNLALEYLRLADRKRPRWLVWENVPGVLSSDGGRDFGSILGGMAELGYGTAYRVLDAQHFGVPQRRRRVFVVGYLGDWRRAAAVLFERHSLSGHPAPRREAGQDVAGAIARCSFSGGASGRPEGAAAGHFVAKSLSASHTRAGRLDPTAETFITHALRGEGFDASEDGTGRGTPLIVDTLTSNGDAHSSFRDEKGLIVDPFVIMERGRDGGSNLEYRQDGTANAILTPNGGRGGLGVGAIAFDCKASGQNGFGIGEIAGTQRAMGHANSHTNGGGHQAVNIGSAVRRLTPRECERLQGFPDDYTAVPYRGKPAADGPRYKALGNSMAVPVMRWIGERIQAVEALSTEARRAA